jgi:hypothetical protein
MSFVADEVMEPTPQNLQQIASLILQASEPDYTRRSAAQTQLSQLDTVVGYKTCLLRIATAHDAVAADARLLATILLKNVVERSWKRVGGRTVKDDEQTALKAALLEQFDIDDARIGVQVSVIIAKVAKRDWPAKWPNLLPSLLQTIQSGDATNTAAAELASGAASKTRTKRALHALHQVLKELASRRLIASRKNFEQAGTQLLSYFAQMWTAHTQHLLGAVNSLDSSDEAAVAALVSG